MAGVDILVACSDDSYEILGIQDDKRALQEGQKIMDILAFLLHYWPILIGIAGILLLFSDKIKQELSPVIQKVQAFFGKTSKKLTQENSLDAGRESWHTLADVMMERGSPEDLKKVLDLGNDLQKLFVNSKSSPSATSDTGKI